ncbi:MAG: hypothetical protein Q9P01_06105 [Anaerolineae bacterium]|nr:hypothetical protein [Anaerolineae bacterium]MDQ7034408.1 hypothetical protein [Anaerolineae bacterium]
MKTLHKFLSGAIIVVTLTTGAAVFAQDDTEAPSSAALCQPFAGERPERPERGAFLEELGLTREDVRAYIAAGGTIQELLAENGIDVEAIRAEHQAEREAHLLDCVAQAQDAGIINAEQAAALTDAIENGTMRELMQSGEFEGVFPHRPRGERANGERPQGRGQRGGRIGGNNGQ